MWTKGMPVCSCRPSRSSAMVLLGSPTSMTTSGSAASSVSRFSSPLPPYSWPSRGRSDTSGQSNSRRSRPRHWPHPPSCRGDGKDHHLGQRADTATFWISVGTVTSRPQESVNTRVVSSVRVLSSVLSSWTFRPQANRVRLITSARTSASNRLSCSYVFSFFH